MESRFSGTAGSRLTRWAGLMWNRLRVCAFVLVALAGAAGRVCAAESGDRPPAASPHRDVPLMRDFMGLNVHTVQFKTDLYAPVCRRLRDYHPLGWDIIGDDPGHLTKFPMAANGVDWGMLYGSWVKAGFDVDACVMFDQVPPGRWKEPAREARAYGEAFARSFGPSGPQPIVSSMEIGNEPSKYDEAKYRTLFEAMARGVRAGDPKLKIATCAVSAAAKPDEWSKPLSAVAGLEDLYDVLNMHSYPFKEHWPTWRRSYPEDSSIPFLRDVTALIDWRDAHAPGKEVWLTEFGYDSATRPPAANGPWAKWVGVSDDEQARYIVRSFLALSATGVDRAYLYFFNDKDQPQLHGASGITRDFHPKASFYALSHLYRALRDYRLARAVAREDKGLYCFEYERPDRAGDRVCVAWLANGDTKASATRVLPIDPGAGRVTRAERMPTTPGDAPRVPWKDAAGGPELEVSGAPVYLWVQSAR
jgi:hypothetical protein